MNAAVAAAVAVTLLTLTITATAVASSPPAPAPGPTADDDAEPAKWSLWPRKHVHIINELGGNKAMTVHCKSKKIFGRKEDKGVQYVAGGREFAWGFRPRFVFGQTKYWCVVSPGGPVHAGFFAYCEFGDDCNSMLEHDNNVYWAVKDDGVYQRDVTGKMRDSLRYVWMPGKGEMVRINGDDDIVIV